MHAASDTKPPVAAGQAEPLVAAGPPAASARRQRGFRVMAVYWAAPAVLFLILFFIFPLIHNGIRGFQAGGTEEFTLDIYKRILFDPYYLEVLAETFILSTAVSAVSLLIGYPVAYFLVRRAKRSHGIIIFLLIAPLLTSIVMRTYGWRVLFARKGLVNVWLEDLGIIDTPLNLLGGKGIVIAALAHVLVPFMVLSISSVLEGIDRQLEDAAQALGAGKFKAFLYVTLPLSLDGIATGFILVFMIANGGFVTLLLLGGGIHTLPLLIFQQFNTTRDFALAAAMGNVLLLTALICLLIQLRLIRRQEARR